MKSAHAGDGADGCHQDLSTCRPRLGGSADLRKTDQLRLSAGDARSCILGDEPAGGQLGPCTVDTVGLVDMINP
jgi:hypothetical protein